MDQFSFSSALVHLKHGQRVTRAGWNGKGMWIALMPVVGVNGEVMTLPYLYMRTVAGGLVPWVASQSDLLAEDWFLT